MASVYFKAKLGQINQLRENNQLKPLVLEMKSCLKCDYEFESEGPHNRLCPRCRKEKIQVPYVKKKMLRV